MSAILRTGKPYDWEQERLNRVSKAMAESELTFARVRGMKIRAHLARQIKIQPFPYPARTCAEWAPIDAFLERRAEARE